METLFYFRFLLRFDPDFMLRLQVAVYTRVQTADAYLHGDIVLANVVFIMRFDDCKLFARKLPQGVRDHMLFFQNPFLPRKAIRKYAFHKYL